MTAAFDGLAARYDELWTGTTTGRLQREAVWRHLEPHARTGRSILDLGCGTGEDALHFEHAGLRVSAFDASPGMVQAARQRGVSANVLPFEELSRLDGAYDGALSNFGALNCMADLTGLRKPLARLIRRGGFLALCVISRVCLWETAHFLLHGQPRKAIRRWSGTSTSVSLDLQVFYPTANRIRRAFAPDFKLIRSAGIGLFVPPSYITGLSDEALETCAAADRRLAHRPGLRALADHRLLLFTRC